MSGSRPCAGAPSTFSTRPSAVRLTRSSRSAAGIPSTAWPQRTSVTPPAVVVTGAMQRVEIRLGEPERVEVRAHVAQRDVLGRARGGPLSVPSRRASTRGVPVCGVDVDDRLRSEPRSSERWAAFGCAACADAGSASAARAMPISGLNA